MATARVQLSSSDSDLFKNKGTLRARIVGDEAFVAWLLSCAMAHADVCGYDVIIESRVVI